MKIKVIAYGIAREIVGDKETWIEIPEAATVGVFLGLMQTQYPELEGLASLKIAVNETYIGSDYLLRTEDEVVLIPPVSGG